MLEKLKLLQNKKILIPALVCLVVVGLVAKRNMAKPQTVATETVARVQVVKVIAKENTGNSYSLDRLICCSRSYGLHLGGFSLS